ncbi:MAG: hypothetical protein M1824_002450 [Vezdaea acicularis]|nr:MAG: hypothetical protein M1824_002450 [Vezdaea acicularis]
MLPRAPPESQQDVRVHSTKDSWLSGQRTAHTTFAPSPSSNMWADGIGDQSPLYHQQVSSCQIQPMHYHTMANVWSGSPDFLSEFTIPVAPTMSLASITESALQSLQHSPAADKPQRPASGTKLNRPRRKQLNSRHPQYTAAEWDSYRSKIKELYIDQNASLETTMESLSQSGFSPSSKKMYKVKFKEWGWSKNLPKDRAQWMLNRAEQRKRQYPEGRDLIFEFGEQSWTVERVRKSIRRAKIAEDEIVALDAPTPYDITYKLSHHVSQSPRNVHSPNGSDVLAGRWTPAPSSGKSQLHFLQSNWNGHTLAEIEAIKREAHRLDCERDDENAEKRYREALAGFENLLSPTHENTNAVAYQLSIFYAEHDRMDDADLVLNWMGEKHVERWGLDHQKTMTHFLRVAELFNSWSRNDEAIAFLYRVLDAWDKHISVSTSDNTTLNRKPPQVAQPQVASPQITVRQSEPRDMTRAFTETDNPTRVDYQLGLAKAHITTKDKTTEPLLLRLIEQCKKYPGKLNSQILQARCELVNLYQQLEDDEKVANALEQARKDLEMILESTVKKTEPLLEACVKIVKLHVKNDYCQAAENMFQRIGGEAEDTLGTDHEATIRILIRIGKFYQGENMWTNAQPWFERALAASMTANGLEDAMTKRLEAALENQHYTVTALTHEELESFVGSDTFLEIRCPGDD